MKKEPKTHRVVWFDGTLQYGLPHTQEKAEHTAQVMNKYFGFGTKFWVETVQGLNDIRENLENSFKLS